MALAILFATVYSASYAVAWNDKGLGHCGRERRAVLSELGKHDDISEAETCPPWTFCTASSQSPTPGREVGAACRASDPLAIV
jgi:hypothetical protein